VTQSGGFSGKSFHKRIKAQAHPRNPVDGSRPETEWLEDKSSPRQEWGEERTPNQDLKKKTGKTLEQAARLHRASLKELVRGGGENHKCRVDTESRKCQEEKKNLHGERIKPKALKWVKDGPRTLKPEKRPFKGWDHRPYPSDKGTPILTYMQQRPKRIRTIKLQP